MPYGKSSCLFRTTTKPTQTSSNVLLVYQVLARLGASTMLGYIH
jgi:hypothetical protein